MSGDIPPPRRTILPGRYPPTRASSPLVLPRWSARPRPRRIWFGHRQIVRRAARFDRVRVLRRGQSHRLVLVEHVVGYRAGILLKPETPVAHHGRDRLEASALLGPGKRDSSQT